MDYSYYMLNELQRLESLSGEYYEELRLLSKRIRKDFWNKNNEGKLSKLLNFMNTTY